MAGMPLDVLKDQLGHADLRMTMRYAKIGQDSPATTGSTVRANVFIRWRVAIRPDGAITNVDTV